VRQKADERAMHGRQQSGRAREQDAQSAPRVVGVAPDRKGNAEGHRLQVKSKPAVEAIGAGAA
jgi:hypothetical protein